jgi:hypothetical protein
VARTKLFGLQPELNAILGDGVPYLFGLVAHHCHNALRLHTSERSSNHMLY